MSRLVAVLTAMALWLAAACGGGSGGSSPPAPQPPGPSPSPVPSSIPSPVPSPSPTASPPPTPQPSGAPSPQPTAAPGPEPAAQVALELARVDPSVECEGLVPDRSPPALTFTVPRPAAATCLGGTGDGTGHVAVGVRDGETVTWTVFAPDGARTGAASGPGLGELTRQADGWHGLISAPLFSPFESAEHVWLRTDGTFATRTAISPPEGFLANEVRIAADPAGGSALAAALTATGGNHVSRVQGLRFDGAAVPAHVAQTLFSDPSPTISFLGVAVSRQGEMIVTYRVPGLLAWSWLSPVGEVIPPAGEVPQVDVAAADPVHLEPLLDGSIAAQFGGVWSAVIPRLGTTASPAPSWLAARPGTVLRFTRGNRGYAVLPPGGELLSDCAQVVELRAPSGLLCGRVTVRDGAGACTGGPVEQGWDGTLIQLAPRGECSGASCACTVRAWPRLLAGP